MLHFQSPSASSQIPRHVYLGLLQQLLNVPDHVLRCGGAGESSHHVALLVDEELGEVPLYAKYKGSPTMTHDRGGCPWTCVEDRQ